MAYRVTAAEVKDIVETSLSNNVVLNRMVHVASTIVDENLDGEVTPALTALTLKNVELYLAAHLVALTEERGALVSSDFGDSKEQLANVYEAGIGSTRYGQTAQFIDTSGILTAIGSTTQKASFRIL